MSSIESSVCARLLGFSDDLAEVGAALLLDSADQAAERVRDFFASLDCAEAEIAYQQIVAAVNARGVRLDKDALQGAVSRAGRELELLAEDMMGEYRISLTALLDDKALTGALLERCGDAPLSLSRSSAERAKYLLSCPGAAAVLAARDEALALQQLTRDLPRWADSPNPVRPLVRYVGCGTGRDAPDTSNPAGLNIHGLRKNPVRGIDLRRLVRPDPGQDFVAADLAQIEARTTAWLTGDAAMLALFATTDPYAAFAANLVRTSPGLDLDDALARAVGKKAVLSLGYGMGLEAFTEDVWSNAPSIGLGSIRAAFEQFHTDFPRVRGGLRELFHAFRDTLRTGTPHELLHLRITRTNQPVIIELPTGRPLFFHAVLDEGNRIYATQRLGARAKEHDEIMLPDCMPRRLVTPPRLFENVIQAIARDVLIHQAVAARRAGLEIAFTIHDEIVGLTEQCRCSSLDGSHRDNCTWLQAQRVLESSMSRIPNSLPQLRDLPIACKVRQEVRRTFA